MPQVTSLTLSPVLERALIYVAIAASTLVAFVNWRRGDTRAFREPLIAFGVLWFVEGALFAAVASTGLVPAALIRGLDVAAIVLLAWAFLASSLSRRAGGLLLGAGLTLAAALSAFSISAMRLTGGEPAWLDTAWSIAALGVSGGTVAALVLGRARDRSSGVITAFVALAVSAAFDALLLGDLAGVSRAIAFWLFPLGLYQRALGDLRSMRTTLREFSESALKQTQELVTLLEASADLFTSFDIEALLHKVTERAATGVEFDRAVVALDDSDAPHALRVACSYPRGLVEEGAAFLLNTQPALALAVSGGEQVTLGPRGQGANALARLLNIDPPGAVVIQPLSTPDDTLGVFIAAYAHSRREFDDRQKRLLQALGAQIAAAILNARLYHNLDRQARELARVLALREDEIGWQTAALEAMNDGVVITDRFDHIIAANNAAIRTLGLSRDQLIGHRLGVIFERLTPLSGAAGGATSAGTVRAAFELGKQVIQASIAPAHSSLGDRLGLVAMFRDITREHQTELNHSQLIGSIAQEFRTPLATVKGYADLLAKGAAGELPSAAFGFVETIRANADRLSGQVNTLLQFNELERGRLELNVAETDVASILADTASSYRPRLEARGLALELRVTPNLPSVRADRARVQQVLDQLLDNAQKFTPDGGRITLSAAPIWDGQSVDRPAHVAVSVADTGIGFEPHDGERLFEQFYRTQEPAQVDQTGLGIGLPIARGICEAMGGYLWASGAKGRGATFTFSLPVARVADPRPAGPPSEDTSIDSWIEHALSFLEDDDRAALNH